MLDQAEGDLAASLFLRNIGGWMSLDRLHTLNTDILTRDSTSLPGSSSSHSASTKPYTRKRCAQDDVKDEDAHERTQRCAQDGCNVGCGCNQVDKKSSKTEVSRRCILDRGQDGRSAASNGSE